jgi:hypothetical protein
MGAPEAHVKSVINLSNGVRHAMELRTHPGAAFHSGKGARIRVQEQHVQPAVDHDQSFDRTMAESYLSNAVTISQYRILVC